MLRDTATTACARRVEYGRSDGRSGCTDCAAAGGVGEGVARWCGGGRCTARATQGGEPQGAAVMCTTPAQRAVLGGVPRRPHLVACEAVEHDGRCAGQQERRARRAVALYKLTPPRPQRRRRRCARGERRGEQREHERREERVGGDARRVERGERVHAARAAEGQHDEPSQQAEHERARRAGNAWAVCVCGGLWEVSRIERRRRRACTNH